MEDIIATAISPTPCLAASILLKPSFLYKRSMFSMTTMALSTNIPKAKISAKRTTIFIVVPIPPSTTKLINMERGMAMPTNKALRSPKKKSNTKTTKITPKMILFSKLLNWSRVCSDWSLVMEIFKFSGKILVCLAVANRDMILSVASSRFSPLFLTTFRDTTGSVFSRA